MARTSMAALITLVRTKIADPAGASQQFSDDVIQGVLDEYRIDVRQELLTEVPSIVNAASTGNVAQFVFADFYSSYGFFEADVILQGNANNGSASWIVLTPAGQELLLDQARFQFQLTPYANGTVPGQYPPVYIGYGKSYDPYGAAAALLDQWTAALSCAVDFSAEGMSIKRSQLSENKLKLAGWYRRKARPMVAKMIRSDVAPDQARLSGVFRNGW